MLGPDDIRVIQDGNRDVSTTSEFRADESGGWIWEASRALEHALLERTGGTINGLRILELGCGTGVRIMEIEIRPP